MKNRAPELSLNLDTFVADMGNLKEIVDATKVFAAKETRLDILINNAAVYVSKFLVNIGTCIHTISRVAAEERLDEYGISFSYTVK